MDGQKNGLLIELGKIEIERHCDGQGTVRGPGEEASCAHRTSVPGEWFHVSCRQLCACVTKLLCRVQHCLAARLLPRNLCVAAR